MCAKQVVEEREISHHESDRSKDQIRKKIGILLSQCDTKRRFGLVYSHHDTAYKHPMA